VHVTSVADPARVPWRVREVVTMSATSVTTQDRQHAADRSRARSLTLAAYVVNLGYLVWFWVMFIGGYWVASWFGIDPVEESITDQGVLGWLAAFGLGVVSAVPSLVGAFLAVRAKDDLVELVVRPVVGRVDLVQCLDDEARRPQQPHPVAVRGVELDPASLPVHPVGLAVTAQERLPSDPLVVGHAQG